MEGSSYTPRRRDEKAEKNQTFFTKFITELRNKVPLEIFIMCEIIYDRKNREINDTDIDSSESPSSSDHERYSNRRNQVTSTSSSRELRLQLECGRLRAEVVGLKAKLAQVEATVVQHECIRDQMRELYDGERKLFEAKIIGLEEERETSWRCMKEARDAHQIAEAELARLKLRLMEDFKSEAVVTSSRHQDDTDDQSDVKYEVEDDIQNMEIEESSTVQEESESIDSEGLCADQSIESQQQVMEEDTEMISRHVSMNLVDDTESSSSTEGWKGWDRESSIVDPKWSSFFLKLDHSGRESLDPNDDGDVDPAGANGPERVKYRQLNVGNEYCVLVADRFFEMDWTKDFRKVKMGRWVCNTCGRIFEGRNRTVDHVWSAHYRQRFKCLNCDANFTFRQQIRNHTRKIHPRIYNF